MKIGKSTLYIFLALILVASLYRIVPGRPYGFAPQIAMAIFAGALIKDRKLAIALPVLSMLLSDALFQLLYIAGISPMWGFYEGQFTNYLLFALLTVFGFFIKKINLLNIALASFAAPTAYFLISNFLVWMSGGGFHRPRSLNGLIMTYNDGLPFYWNSIAGTLFFAGVFFGGLYLMKHYSKTPEVVQ